MTCTGTLDSHPSCPCESCEEMRRWADDWEEGDWRCWDEWDEPQWWEEEQQDIGTL